MPFRFWHGTLEDNLAPDRASKLKPKSAEIFTLLSTVLTSCHRVLCSGSFTGNVCGMHPCTSWQKWKKKKMKNKWNENSSGQSRTVRAEKLSGWPHPLLRPCSNLDFSASTFLKTLYVGAQRQSALIWFYSQFWSEVLPYCRLYEWISLWKIQWWNAQNIALYIFEVLVLSAS